MTKKQKEAILSRFQEDIISHAKRAKEFGDAWALCVASDSTAIEPSLSLQGARRSLIMAQYLRTACKRIAQSEENPDILGEYVQSLRRQIMSFASWDHSSTDPYDHLKERHIAEACVYILAYLRPE